MKSLTDLGLKENMGFKGNSPLAGLAIELAYHLKEKQPDLALQLTELALSFVNLKNTSLLAYGRTALHIEKIIEESDDMKIHSFLKLLTEFSYNFIIIGKSAIDLVACIVDSIENRTVKKTDGFFTDISKYDAKNDKIRIEFNNLKNKKWVKELESIRNRIIHKGITIEFKCISSSEQKNNKIRTLMDEKIPMNFPPFTPENFSIIDEMIQKQMQRQIQRNKELSEEQNKKYEPIIETYLIKRNLSWTGEGKNLDHEWFSDGNGNVKSKIDIGIIAEGLALDFYVWEKNLSNLFISEHFIPELTSYTKLKCSFTSHGYFIVHPRVGDF